MDERFLRPGFDFCLAHTVSECGEFLHAAGKTQQWGPGSHNPLLPKQDREINIIWLLREMDDVKGAIDRLQSAILADLSLAALIKANRKEE